jgi:hypothetical protein
MHAHMTSFSATSQQSTTGGLYALHDFFSNISVSLLLFPTLFLLSPTGCQQPAVSGAFAVHLHIISIDIRSSSTAQAGCVPIALNYSYSFLVLPAVLCLRTLTCW